MKTFSPPPSPPPSSPGDPDPAPPSTGASPLDSPADSPSAASFADARAGAVAPYAQPSAPLRQRLERARARLVERIGKVRGRRLCLQYTGEIDRLLQSHFEKTLSASGLQSTLPRRMAMLALGGYGRREMCLYSDVDLLFVFKTEPRPEEEEFLKAFLYPLWDVGLDLGQAVRTEAGALEVVGSDLDSTTALIESRFLAGSESLHERLAAKLRKSLNTPKGAIWYVDSKLEDVAKRHRKYGDSIYLLEPYIKEGCGGLRDIHSMLWLSFVVFGNPTLDALGDKKLLSTHAMRSLNDTMGFLLDIRNALHSLERRKTDHLTFERQIRVAERLGFQAAENALAEEQLMRVYYTHARRVLMTATRVVEHVQRHAPGLQKRARDPRHPVAGPFFVRRGKWLYVDEKQRHWFRRDPDLILKAFSLAAGSGLRTRQDLRDIIEHHLPEFDESFRTSPVNRDLFLGILRGPRNVFQTLHDMHDCGALGAFLPEFDLVRHLPRLDFYHQYTVDEHLLLALRFAERLRVGPADADPSPARPDSDRSAESLSLDAHAAEVARDIKRWDLFNLALLLHDVGKGEGRGHVIRGAHLIERATERMNLPAQDRDLCRTLVLNHQKMSHLAQRRNVEDPEVARELARELGDREILRMLYVMTLCDLRAVGNNVLNDWRAKLLRDLYERTMDRIRDHRPALIPRGVTGVATPAKVLQAIEKIGLPPLDARAIERFLAGMPERYLLSTTAREMALHCHLSGRLGKDETIQWRLDPLAGRNYSQLTVAAEDAPGLFSHICGALASRGINILAAQIYTGARGVCLDVFHVQDQRGQPLEAGGWLDRLRKRLIRVLAGEHPPTWEADAAQTKNAAHERLFTPDRIAIRPPTVEFNNNASAQHTVIEIKSPDRPGLLHSITRIMDQERINIDLALVTTEAYRVVDVFYVTDLDNNKLEGETTIARLRKALLDAIESRMANPATLRPPENRKLPPATQKPETTKKPKKSTR